MKKILLLTIIPLLALTLSANSESVAHETISKQIDEIKPPRVGIKRGAVAKVRSPFIYLKTVKTKNGKKTTVVDAKKRIRFAPLKLESAINKNVKINGKWYKEGDRVRGYTIVKVSTGEAHLKSKKKELKLYLKKTNDRIKFSVN